MVSKILKNILLQMTNEVNENPYEQYLRNKLRNSDYNHPK